MYLNVVPALFFSFLIAPASSFWSTLSRYPAFQIIQSQALSIFNQHFSEECASDVLKLVSDLSKPELWALKMLDASGKMNPNLLNGNVHFLGDYDQCLSISENIDGRTINGQYCTLVLSMKESPFSSDLKKGLNLTAHINHFLPAKLNALVLFGLCLPRSCSTKDFRNFTHHLSGLSTLPVEVTVKEELCSYKGKSVEITRNDIFVYSFFSIVLLVIVLSTLHDLHLRYLGQDPNIFVIFSAYTNLEQLFAEHDKSNAKLACLNGIKVLSSWWVILGHLSIGVVLSLKNPIDALNKWIFDTFGVIAWSARYSVTNFFLISGFLVSYSYLKYSDRMSINLLSFYLARYARLTPALLATTLIHTSVLKLLTDGPYGQFILNSMTTKCQGDWWKSLFYFINWSKQGECVPQTWFLLVDSQLYLFAPLILFFLRKYPRAVLTQATLAFLAGIIYTSLATIYKRLGATVFDYSRDLEEYLYLSSAHHLPSWLIGVGLGYVLYQDKIRISKGLNLILWAASIGVMLKVVYGQVSFITEDYDLYRVTLWNALAKPLWSLALSFIIFSCANGNGGFMHAFLSLPVWRVLSKLTYSTYLTHAGVLFICQGNMRETFYVSHLLFVREFFRIYFITLVCATLLYLGFEAPIMAVKYHMDRQGKKKN